MSAASDPLSDSWPAANRFHQPVRAAAPQPSAPASRTFHCSTWIQPSDAQSAGGDWCEASQPSDDLLLFSLGDVCGHGVAAAREMTILRDAFAADANKTAQPQERLRLANKIACRRESAVPVTAIAGRLDCAGMLLTFANAGHPPPIVVGPHGTATLTTEAADLPLGIESDYRATSLVVRVAPETLLVFYSDGVTEHMLDAIAGEEELRAAASLAYRSRGQNDARTIALHMNLIRSLPDDAMIFTIRMHSN